MSAGKTEYGDRFVWLDIAKGMTILLMILGHSSLPIIISHWIWSFHMPLFFFVSGMMFVPGKRRWGNFFSYEVRKILWPFIICSLIVLAMARIYESNWFAYFLRVITYGWGGMPLWFIPIFFVMRMVVFSVCNKASILLACTGLFICLVIGTLLDFYNIELPYNLSSIFIASAFGISGFIFSFFVSIQNIHRKKRGIWAIITLCTGFFISRFYSLDLCTNSVIPIIPLYAGALCGIFSILSFSIYLEESWNKYKIKNFFVLCGKNTFLLMAFASPVMLLLLFIFGKTMVTSVILSTILRYFLLAFFLTGIIYVINKRMKWIMDFNMFCDSVKRAFRNLK